MPGPTNTYKPRPQSDPLYVNDQLITLENAQAILDGQLKQMFALEDTKREQETEIAGTEWKIAEIDEEVWYLRLCVVRGVMTFPLLLNHRFV